MKPIASMATATDDQAVSSSHQAMPPAERRTRIVDLLRKRGRVTVGELAHEFSASFETIRRDLTELSARNLIQKFHGGATLLDAAVPGSKIEGSFQGRMLEHQREKRAIARRAAGLFSPGDSLFIDTGTTTLIFAEELARLSRLTVITNSIAIVQTIARGTGQGNKAFLLGGEYSDDAGENVGRLTVEQIVRFRAAHAVLTVGAIEKDGVMDYDLNEAEIATAMVSHARQVTILADSSKLGRVGLFLVCPLAGVDRLVIDRAPDGTIAEELQLAQIEVLLATSTDGVIEPAPSQER
jgi:DeoR family glycerol-3-phosphate regulon repressor